MPVSPFGKLGFGLGFDLDSSLANDTDEGLAGEVATNEGVTNKGIANEAKCSSLAFSIS